MQSDNNRLRTAIDYMKQSQVTHHCENCESSAKKIEELQKKLKDAISNIPKVCPTCMYRDATGDIMNVNRCEGCYFNGVPAWEWNGKANHTEEGNNYD